jgi:hypothetical protein
MRKDFIAKSDARILLSESSENPEAARVGGDDIFIPGLGIANWRPVQNKPCELFISAVWVNPSPQTLNSNPL